MLLLRAVGLLRLSVLVRLLALRVPQLQPLLVVSEQQAWL